MPLPSEFRINHRAASESLQAVADDAATADSAAYDLIKARYFAAEARDYATNPRMRALNLGIAHAADMMEEAARAEFGDDYDAATERQYRPHR